MDEEGGATSTGWGDTRDDVWHPPNWHRSLQLVLATIWLLDGVLQLQPSMFTAGSAGLSRMLAQSAAGNPRGVASSISWDARIVDHHALAANAVFAAIQVGLGLGIAWRPALRPALAGSVVWSLAVWWFGEGLGGVLHGAGSPIAGGPGPVLLYAALAIALWPRRGAGAACLPFAAAGALGERTARRAWAALWVVLAFLCLLGSARSPSGVKDAIDAAAEGEPKWLSALDHGAASLVSGKGLGLALALLLCALFLVAAGAVYFPLRASRAVLVLVMVVALCLWVVTQNFGMILAGGATDPDSGPLLVLLVLCYWPLGLPIRATGGHTLGAATRQMAEAGR